MTSNPNFVTIVGVISRESKMVGKEYKKMFSTVAGVMKVGERDFTFFQQIRAGGDEGKFGAMIPAGTPVVVTGVLRYETWDDPSTGEKKKASYVKVNSVRALPHPETYAVEQRVSPGGDPYFIMTTGAYISATISGNISRANLNYTNDGKPVLSGSFASKEEWIQNGETKEHTNWLGFTVWGPEAEALAEQGIGKGWSIALIDGTVSSRTSKGKDGQTYLNVDVERGNGRLSFLPKRGGGATSFNPDDAFALPDEELESSLPF